MGTFLAVAFCMIVGALLFQMIRVELFLMPELRDIIRRAKAVLSIIEGQHRATEAGVDRVVLEVQAVKRDTVRAADVASQAATVAKQTQRAIDEVPKKVKDVLDAHRAGDSAGDSDKFPAVRPQEGKA